MPPLVAVAPFLEVDWKLALAPTKCGTCAPRVKDHFVVGRSSPQESIDFQLSSSALEHKIPPTRRFFSFEKNFTCQLGKSEKSTHLDRLY